MAFLIDPEIADRVDRIEIDFNRYGVDAYGVSKTELARMYTIMSKLYYRYFTVRVSGIEHVPSSGRAMLVGNHSGGVALDGTIVSTSMFLEADPPRLVQAMVDKFMNRVPFMAQLNSRLGQLTGLPEHAVRLLEDDRLLMVFPEGHRGTAKLYGDRNSLVRFGTGFIRLALQTKTPVVPFAFIGGGDAVPTITNLEGVAKLFGLPYLPITPYLLPIPRPVALEVYYSEPMHFEGTGNEDDVVIQGYVEQVRARISELIDRGVKIRLGRGEASFS
ncbi:MAG: acyltransferase family protein [Kofleriaceae bacterium]|nr:acyltransferase family protein [Kofleriaceae bacterium]